MPAAIYNIVTPRDRVPAQVFDGLEEGVRRAAVLVDGEDFTSCSYFWKN